LTAEILNLLLDISFFMAQIQTNAGTFPIEGSPNECPFCHNLVTPIPLYGYKVGNTLEVQMICPNQKCKKSFLAYYSNYGNFFSFDNRTSIGDLANKNFSEPILLTSENFVLIYNQAYAAEQFGLTEICGVGYRKALEFLIKDYAILNNPEKRDIIEKKFLGACITEYVDDSKVKSVAKRAVWIGNDETHYIRKWEGKNLEDLKRLIDLTVHWIEMESLTKSFEFDMPE
jgi:hypothetical protein